MLCWLTDWNCNSYLSPKFPDDESPKFPSTPLSLGSASRCVDRLRNPSGSWIKENGSHSELENIRVRLQNSSRVHIEQHSTRMVHWLFILIHYSGRFFVRITIECNFSRFPFSFNFFYDHSLDTFRSCFSYSLMWVSFMGFYIINPGVCKERYYSDDQYRTV